MDPSQQHPESAPAPRRCRDERGAVVVEFALMTSLLMLIVFAIITFGLILSFKQDVTRAAAEGARAGAVAYSNNPAVSHAQQAEADAWAETVRAVDGFGRTCGANGAPGPDGMRCQVSVAPCAGTAAADCVTVELVYDYDNHPLIAKVPLVSGVLPSQIKASSVSRINS